MFPVMEPAGCRVLLNDRCLRNPLAGVGRYVTEILAGLARSAPDIQILPFYSRLRGRAPQIPSRPIPGVASPAMTPPPRRPTIWARRAAQAIYETAFELAGTMGKYRLYHEPNHIPSPWQGPILTTIHDLSVLRFPDWHPADRVSWYERQFEGGLARTHHFISVSEFTRREMVERLGVQADRITVIPLGIGPEFRLMPPELIAAWCRTAGLDPGFLLYVGTIEPRKNLPGLLEAYARLPAMLRDRHPLVIAGMPGWGRADVLGMARRHGIHGSLRILGYVRDEVLPLLYNAAIALVWPTLYEGFGLPPLEAMACGTPAITSNVSSLPEVVGDAALLVDPLSSQQLAESLHRMIEDTSLRADLSRRGLARAGHFSWEQCASAHADLYRRHALD